MGLCPSCGGVLGRDCFNPVDCAVISAQLVQEANRPRPQHPLVAERDQLRQQVEGLLEATDVLVTALGYIHGDPVYRLKAAADQVRKELGEG